MNYSMSLEYVTDTGIEITIESNADGVIIHTKDGNHTDHIALMAQDAVELSNMLIKASQHSKEINKNN